MGLMLLFRGSESLLLLPAPPEPPPFVFPPDLLAGVSAPDPPDPPDASDTLVVLDLSSFPCHCFTLAAARSPLHCTTTSDSVCLLIVSLGVNLVNHLLLPTDGFRFQIYNFIWGKTRFFSLFLGIAWKGMTLVIRLDVSSWDGTYRRFGFLVLRIRNHSRPLPQYEDLMLLVSHRLTQYEAVRHLFCLPLPQYEVHLLQYKGYLTRHEVVVRNVFLDSLQYICVLVVFSYPWWFLQLYTSLWLRISSQFQGSSSWCLITSVAKFLAALYAFVAAACSGSSSLNVFSNSRGFISLSSTHVVSLLSCLCVMFAFIYVCAIRCAFDAAVYLANVAVLLFLLNNSSIDGV
ncbi:hypothetical protein Bca52824_048922 [Brassica carinata]|uniref:Uncharacterized protein n=1 Tax=Brassica carinata TaxID=52824 RepID=A0A8X7RJV5_BRACI|nr:hypothetical protein Bca52824_048922 [Brassica carinata]